MNSSQPSPFQTVTPQSPPARRARVKFAVFSVIAINVVFCLALLLTQGCKRNPESDQPAVDTLLTDTNLNALTDTNVVMDPWATTTNVVDQTLSNVTTYVDTTLTTSVTASTYVIKSGDTFDGIARRNNTTAAAIAAANPTVDPRRLKINSTINLPAPSATVGTAVPVTTASGEITYIVKSGDTLSSIAARHGTTVTAIKRLNSLSTDRIAVKQKLLIPVKAPAPVAPVADPVIMTPVAPPTTTPVR